LSIVCAENHVASDECRAEPGWRCLRVSGTLDFETVGVIAALSTVLAVAKISLFVVSTYNTDYLLVRQDDLSSAIAALVEDGHTVDHFGETKTG
jgi:hypothetical protein